MVTVTEQVISDIRERILDGKFGPGAHLHEVALAADVGVSRTPIRDALRILANEGLLVYFPNRGYFVRSVELSDVLDAYDVRGTLEGMACRVIAERGLSDDEEETLTALLDKGDAIFHSSAWGADEQAAWRALNTEFHFALLGISRNLHLDPILRQVRFFPRIFDSRLEPESEFFQKVHPRDQRLRSHHEHGQIVQALIRGESGRAEALMREHVYVNRDLLRLAFEHVEANDQATHNLG